MEIIFMEKRGKIEWGSLSWENRERFITISSDSFCWLFSFILESHHLPIFFQRKITRRGSGGIYFYRYLFEGSNRCCIERFYHKKNKLIYKYSSFRR